MKARAKTPPAFRTHRDIERWPWRGLTVTALHHVLHYSKICDAAPKACKHVSRA